MGTYMYAPVSRYTHTQKWSRHSPSHIHTKKKTYRKFCSQVDASGAHQEHLSLSPSKKRKRVHGAASGAILELLWTNT